MANKELKNRTPIGSAIDKKLYKELKQYSRDTGIPMSKLLALVFSKILLIRVSYVCSLNNKIHLQFFINCCYSHVNL